MKNAVHLNKVGDTSRQGDLYIMKVKEISSDSDMQQKTDGILIYGEITGHKHAVKEKEETELYEDKAGTLWLRVKEATANIVHEDHKTHVLSPGNYKIWRQREWDYSLENFRNVAD